MQTMDHINVFPPDLTVKVSDLTEDESELKEW